MPKTVINRVKLFWELSGDTGEPIVLVHGSWMDHHNWDAVVPSLARSFRVLTYDRRGHSRSERPATPGGLRADIADLAALLEELQIGPAHVLGASSGGSIALGLAGERPDLFRSLVAHEPPLVGLLSDPFLAPMVNDVRVRIEAVVELLAAGDMEAGARRFVESIAFGPGAWDRMPQQTRETAILNGPAFLDEMRDPEAFAIDLDGLRGFFSPVLLTLGTISAPFFPQIAQRLSGVLAHAELNIFPGAGHEPQQSHPQAYAASILSFIGRSRRNSHRRGESHGHSVVDAGCS